jgi:hypothetical protein
LDSLCGAYAVINGISLMASIDAEALFSHLIEQMHEHLPVIILRGLRTQQLRQLVLAPCRDFCAARHQLRLRYQTCRASSLDQYWETLQNHIAVHGPGSIILGVDEHWTCIRRITDKTILLADSVDWNRLYRRYISLDTDRKHLVFPEATFLLEISRG